MLTGNYANWIGNTVSYFIGNQAYVDHLTEKQSILELSKLDINKTVYKNQ